MLYSINDVFKGSPMMKGLIKKQQGLTLISIVFILILIGAVVLLVLKIAPIYMNHSKVVNALEAVEAMPEVQSMSKREIESSLLKRFNLNYVEDITMDDVEIIKQPGYLSVRISYEVEQPIIGNLSVLVDFDDGFEKGGE
jgi:competence protein ComGC